MYMSCFRVNIAAAAAATAPLIVCYFKQFDLYSCRYTYWSIWILSGVCIVSVVLFKCLLYNVLLPLSMPLLDVVFFLEFKQHLHMANEFVLRFLTVLHGSSILLFQSSISSSSSFWCLSFARTLYHHQQNEITCCAVCCICMDNFHYRSFSCAFFLSFHPKCVWLNRFCHVFVDTRKKLIICTHALYPLFRSVGRSVGRWVRRSALILCLCVCECVWMRVSNAHTNLYIVIICQFILLDFSMILVLYFIISYVHNGSTLDIFYRYICLSGIWAVMWAHIAGLLFKQRYAILQLHIFTLKNGSKTKRRRFILICM